MSGRDSWISRQYSILKNWIPRWVDDVEGWAFYNLLVLFCGTTTTTMIASDGPLRSKVLPKFFHELEAGLWSLTSLLRVRAAGVVSIMASQAIEWVE